MSKGKVVEFPQQDEVGVAQETEMTEVEETEEVEEINLHVHIDKEGLINFQNPNQLPPGELIYLLAQLQQMVVQQVVTSSIEQEEAKKEE